MTSTTHSFTAPDGRTIAATTSGPDDAPLVLLAHPAPGSRRLDPDPAATAAAGVRLLTVDRPGYGGSDPVPDGAPHDGIRSVADAADDAALVLDALGGTPALATGWSAGGRVVLALAARRPDLVRGVGVLGTPAPHEEVAWIPDEFVGLIAQLAADRPTAVSQLTGMLAETTDPDGVEQLTGGAPSDERVLATGDVRERVVAMLTEGFRQGAAGVAADIASYTLRDWGFDARAVGAPTRYWYGAEDAVVSADHGRWYAGRTGGELVVVPEVGHLVGLTAWADVLAWGAGLP